MRTGLELHSAIFISSHDDKWWVTVLDNGGRRQLTFDLRSQAQRFANEQAFRLGLSQVPPDVADLLDKDAKPLIH